MSLDLRWKRWLDTQREQGRHRELKPPAGIDFSSNDYLGYAPFLVTITGKTSATASRLLRGHHPDWGEVEATLAAWHGTESVLMMTSGYVANEGLLSTVIEPGDWVASDERNHASIIDGLRLSRAEKFIYRHQDLNQLEEGLRSAPTKGERFIVTESLFSMDGDRTPLAEIASLAKRYGAHLIVDEAHATGCFGRHGSGLVDELNLRSQVLATVHTGGKALGVMGAYIGGSMMLRDLLVNRCRHLIFTTALPPLLALPWQSTIARVRSDDDARRRLHANATHFRRELQRAGVTAGGSDYIVPIVIGDDAKAVQIATQLQTRGWDVRAIRPPSVPAGTARLRVSIHADHDPGVLTELAVAIGEMNCDSLSCV